MQAIRQNEQVNRLSGDTDLNRFAYPAIVHVQLTKQLLTLFWYAQLFRFLDFTEQHLYCAVQQFSTFLLLDKTLVQIQLSGP